MDMFFIAFILAGVVFVGGLGGAFALRQSGKKAAGDLLFWLICAIWGLGILLGWESKGIFVLLPPFAMQEAMFFFLGVDWQGTQACARGYNC